MRSIMCLLDGERRRTEVAAAGRVKADSARCVQCGVCTYNCPVGIDVRAYSWQGIPVSDRDCISCGECVARCPRGALHFEHVAF